MNRLHAQRDGMTPQADHNRVAQVVCFLLHRAGGGALGASKLWKLAYYVDLLHVEQFGAPVTGLSYRKKRHGPVPEGEDAILDELVARGALAVEEIRRFRHSESICRLAGAPDLRDFAFSERAILEEVALDWLRATGGQLEAAIRESAPWKAVGYGAILPIMPKPPAS